MQVVKVEFVTHFHDVQQAVDAVSSHLPCIGRLPPGHRIESWDIYSVDEYVTTKVSHPVEDGKVEHNG